jgi:hypothetical protein
MQKLLTIANAEEVISDITVIMVSREWRASGNFDSEGNVFFPQVHRCLIRMESN